MELLKKEEEQIRRIIKMLTKGIIISKDSKYNDYYLNAVNQKIKTEIQNRLQMLGFEVEYNEQNETIKLKSDFDDVDYLNHCSFNKIESIYLLFFKRMLLEKSKKLIITDNVFTTMEEVFSELSGIFNDAEIVKEKNLREAVAKFKRYGLVDTIGDLKTSKDTKIILYKSLNAVITIREEETLREMYKEYLNAKTN